MNYYKLIATTGLIASLAIPALANTSGNLRVDANASGAVNVFRGGQGSAGAKSETAATVGGTNVLAPGLGAKLDARAQINLNPRRQSFENSVGVRVRAIFDQLGRIEDRVNARLAEAKARGAQTQTAEVSLSAYREHRAEADRIALSIQSRLDASTDETNKAQLKSDVKKEFESMKTHLKKAHESLRDAWKATVQAEASVNASANK